jgi:hypothetical protein
MMAEFEVIKKKECLQPLRKNILRRSSSFWFPRNLSNHMDRQARDGILGHKFEKRLESFAQCYSQSLLLADFKENHTLLWFYKSVQKIPQNGESRVYS